mmetsp:Transcript_22284/g.35493  ORF Transcript_22284/g.35493 Transcript_22284/m.35493 type:complete len:226 (+) Transcript_22284:566-1243(+)|eukprot:CAMPEP_0184406118 /NCGR_PEP_ID=MMETSP0738-20130409/1309_1 /TAXON_ID=385413 /ORGANISM="Thalassiosira miniscula, Strain CCMP1093" /LENGTH=225 /DNA_ID=CAMNT_0026762883 /DNA_START=566 /DNA_END=1243 /DNA_ORIENTATION=+
MIRQHLLSQGVFLRLGKNLDHFAEHIERAPERYDLHDQFDPRGDLDGATSAFWVCGFDGDGNLVHTQAAKLLELGKRSIADHVAAHLWNYNPKAQPLIKSSIKTMAGPKISNIRGRVVYHGEMWLQKRLRDRGTPAIVNRLGMLLAVREWDPDAIFGPMSWTLACEGFNMRIGYHHSEPMTVTWQKKTGNAQHQLWAVFMERDDIEFLLNLPAVEFSSALRSKFA